MRWIAALVVVVGCSSLALAGPRQHSAEGVVKVKLKRGKVKSIKIGDVTVVMKVLQPDAAVRDGNEAEATRNYKRLAAWDGKQVKVTGLTGFEAGRIRRMGNTTMAMPSRVKVSQIQVLKIEAPNKLTDAAAQTFQLAHGKLSQAGKDFKAFGPAGPALPQLSGEVRVRGFVFPSGVVYVEQIAMPGEEGAWIVGVHKSGDVLVKAEKTKAPERRKIGVQRAADGLTTKTKGLFD